MEEKKSLMCRLGRHRYRVHYNHEGQDYFLWSAARSTATRSTADSATGF